MQTYDYMECPFCGKSFPFTNDTFSEKYPCFKLENWSIFKKENMEGEVEYINLDSSGLIVQFKKCPACKKVNIDILGVGSQFPDGYKRRFYPSSRSKQYPDYIPSYIIQDYKEAYDILELSPKASATLSRRCLQSMIRDKWEVNKRNLYSEIDAIKDKIDPKIWKAIDSVRSIGNIGAHMEKDTNLIIDIEPWEAENLIKLIEILIKTWYIDEHERNILLNEIIETGKSKNDLRNSKK